MIDMHDAMGQLLGSIRRTASDYGFELVRRENAVSKETQIVDRGEKSCFFDLSSAQKGVTLRFVFNGNRIVQLNGPVNASAEDDSDFELGATYFFDLDTYNERDVTSLANEVCDQLSEIYDEKNVAKKTAAPAAVSKAAAKSGALSYDPPTLTLKLAAMYPGFKDEMNANIARYGEFLFEEFYVSYGNAFILDTVRQNDPKKMKKLFSILNAIYEDGTNEVQSLIVVTILGSIDDDPAMMQNILPYVSDSMAEPVIAVNEYLKKSKSAKMRLSNPPRYKPKKQKTVGRKS